ncbi:uncharacterized protein LOC103104116 [Monodelphis domestica]|uniref:uncharacterized protein LOC103104116 n=1 Tax=Monodelphis domestica TaxID=13616 RepID=UPI0024E1AA7F|nr:uncharacterized protein LOC103104116 [Monodelphis domestica]
MELKRIIEEEGQKYKKDLKEIDERTNNLIEKLKKYVNISEVNIGNQPEETVKEDITTGQLLAAEDISLDITIKKEPVEELVEEEISSGKPAMGKAIMQFSWFCNVQGYNWRNFFCFKKHDKQVKNVRKQEETDLKLLVSDWTETQVGHWLKSIGMKKYILKFDYKRIRGQELLELDNDALKCIGITKKRDRKKILKGIKKIQQTEKN